MRDRGRREERKQMEYVERKIKVGKGDGMEGKKKRKRKRTEEVE